MLSASPVASPQRLIQDLWLVAFRIRQLLQIETSPKRARPAFVFFALAFLPLLFLPAQRPVDAIHYANTGQIMPACTGSASSLEEDPPACISDVDRGYPAMIRMKLECSRSNPEYAYMLCRILRL